MSNLATVLTHLMSEMNISSAELARKTGVAQPVVYRLMTGVTENPQILTIKPIANFFGVSIEQLVGMTTLGNKKIDDLMVHNINSKLSAIKLIASVLADFLPGLIEGYQKAFSANLIKETVSIDILPLLILNTDNLLKTANQIQELITINNHNILQD